MVTARLSAHRTVMKAARTSLGQLAAGAAMVALVTACSASGGNSSGSGACAATIKFHGATYLGNSLRTHPPYNKIGEIPRSHLERIGSGVIPSCADGSNGSTAAERVNVARISGVNPVTAIAVLPDGRVFLRRGAAMPAVLKSAAWIRWITP